MGAPYAGLACGDFDFALSWLSSVNSVLLHLCALCVDSGSSLRLCPPVGSSHRSHLSHFRFSNFQFRLLSLVTLSPVAPTTSNHLVLNALQVILDRDGTSMVTSVVIVSHQPRPSVLLGTIPPASETPLFFLTPLLPSSSALFSAMAPTHLYSFQTLTHSFYRHGGVPPSQGELK